MDTTGSPQTFLTHLECSVCGDRHSPHEIQTVCRSCGKSLVACYDLQKAKSQFTRESLKNQKPSMWRYRALLPIERAENIVSFGEGMTPVIHLKTLGSELKLPALFMKDDGQLPTGSFNN